VKERGMEYRRLGRTGLEVSVMGIGTGGPSQFGQKSGVPEGEVVRLVRRALELGINFFDSSAAYGESEGLLGLALREVPREDYILATKFLPVRKEEVVSPEDVVASVERSRERLRVDVIDIVQFHGVKPGDYRRVMENLLPTAQKLRDQGKFRFLGISETAFLTLSLLTTCLPNFLFCNILDSVAVRPCSLKFARLATEWGSIGGVLGVIGRAE